MTKSSSEFRAVDGAGNLEIPPNSQPLSTPPSTESKISGVEEIRRAVLSNLEEEDMLESNPELAERLTIYLDSLNNALVRLSPKYKLSFLERVALKNALVKWIISKLDIFPNYQPILVVQGFMIMGEKAAEIIVAKRSMQAEE